jgi:hypothetical protein
LLMTGALILRIIGHTRKRRLFHLTLPPFINGAIVVKACSGLP